MQVQVTTLMTKSFHSMISKMAYFVLIDPQLSPWLKHHSLWMILVDSLWSSLSTQGSISRLTVALKAVHPSLYTRERSSTNNWQKLRITSSPRPSLLTLTPSQLECRWFSSGTNWTSEAQTRHCLSGWETKVMSSSALHCGHLRTIAVKPFPHLFGTSTTGASTVSDLIDSLLCCIIITG